MIVEESMHVIFDETNPNLQDEVSKNAYEDDLLQENNSVAKKQSAIKNQSIEKEKQPTKKAADNNLPKDWIGPRRLSKHNIIGDIKQGVSTRRKLVFYEHVAFVSQIELKNVNDALNDSNSIVAVQDELNQFTLLVILNREYPLDADLYFMNMLLLYLKLNLKMRMML